MPSADPAALETGEDHPLERPLYETRAPRAEDIEDLVRIDAAWSGRERRGYLGERLRRALRPSGISLARVCVHEGRVVGFLLGEVTGGEFGRVGSAAWIDTVGVDRSQGRRGVGSALLQDFMRHAQVLGCERVRTLLDPEDEVLTGFLEAHLFRVAPTKVVERALEGVTR